CGPSRRRIEYVVTGGAGAYMSATRRIPKVNHTRREGAVDTARRRGKIEDAGNYKGIDYDPPESVLAVREAQFRCYPTRGDSLAFYARWFGRRLFNTGAALWGATALAVAALVVWQFALGGNVGGQS